MRSGAYQQPAWCWHLVWGSKGSKIQKKQFHADLQKSNWKRIYCVLHIIWRVPHSYGTGFGRFLEPGVLTCARPHDTVTQWPLSLPLGDLSMVLGNYRWDAQREMNCRRVKAKEFDYRALFQCRMATELLVYAYFGMFMFHPAFLHISRRLRPICDCHCIHRSRRVLWQLPMGKNWCPICNQAANLDSSSMIIHDCSWFTSVITALK